MLYMVRHGWWSLWKPLRDVRQQYRRPSSIALIPALCLVLACILPHHMAVSASGKTSDRYTWPNSPWRTSDYPGGSAGVGNSTLSAGGVGGMGVTQSNSLQQCLVLNSHLSKEVCQEPVRRRTQKMRHNTYRLKFCSNYHVNHVIDQENCNLEGSEQECQQCFDQVDILDQKIHSMYCQFQDIISRFDCKGNFSTHWGCEDCTVSPCFVLFVWQQGVLNCPWRQP